MNGNLMRSLLLLIVCSFLSLSADAVSAADDKVVATVQDQPIKASEVAAQMEAAKLSRDEALGDLIEQKQLRVVAAARGVPVPAGTWSAADRATVEAALLKALSLAVPSYVGFLVVDHAYFKIPRDKKKQKAGLAQMQRLRSLVEKGATIPEAYNQLKADGTNWHIGAHEEYPATVLPDEARNLATGGLTPVLISSDGYNLFKLHERKIPADEITRAVRIYLIENAADMVKVIEE